MAFKDSKRETKTNLFQTYRRSHSDPISLQFNPHGDGALFRAQHPPNFPGPAVPLGAFTPCWPLFAQHHDIRSWESICHHYFSTLSQSGPASATIIQRACASMCENICERCVHSHLSKIRASTFDVPRSFVKEVKEVLKAFCVPGKDVKMSGASEERA